MRYVIFKDAQHGFISTTDKKSNNSVFKKKLVKPMNVIWHYKLVMGHIKQKNNKFLFWDTITVLSLFDF